MLDLQAKVFYSQYVACLSRSSLCLVLDTLLQAQHGVRLLLQTHWARVYLSRLDDVSALPRLPSDIPSLLAIGDGPRLVEPARYRRNCPDTLGLF